MDRMPSFPTVFGQAMRGLADPFAAMRREMERLFQEMGAGSPLPAGFISPKVDVAETEQGLEIHAELPGVKPEEISLDLTEGVLTLKAERSEEEEGGGQGQALAHRRARLRYLHPPLRLRLPGEGGEITATFENGVLKVSIPRAKPEAKPQRKIAIRTGGG